MRNKLGLLLESEDLGGGPSILTNPGYPIAHNTPGDPSYLGVGGFFQGTQGGPTMRPLYGSSPYGAAPWRGTYRATQSCASPVVLAALGWGAAFVLVLHRTKGFREK